MSNNGKRFLVNVFHYFRLNKSSTSGCLCSTFINFLQEENNNNTKIHKYITTSTYNLFNAKNLKGTNIFTFKSL